MALFALMAAAGIFRFFASQPLPAAVSGSPAPRREYRVDLNAAGPERLRLLPGIGPVTAKAIVEYRAEHGPFKDISELRNVPGIGRGKIDAISPFVILSNENGPGK